MEESSPTGAELKLNSGQRYSLKAKVHRFRIALAIDPSQAESQDDEFILWSTDGQYKQSKTVKDDMVPGDQQLSLDFLGVRPGQSYSLLARLGDRDLDGLNDEMLVFRNVPFEQLQEGQADPHPAPEETPDPVELGGSGRERQLDQVALPQTPPDQDVGPGELPPDRGLPFRIKLAIDPELAQHRNDTFRLFADDGTFHEEKSIQDDAEAGDDALTLEFRGLEEGKTYSMAMSLGDDDLDGIEEEVLLFEGIPFEQLVGEVQAGELSPPEAPDPVQVGGQGRDRQVGAVSAPTG